MSQIAEDNLRGITMSIVSSLLAWIEDKLVNRDAAGVAEISSAELVDQVREQLRESRIPPRPPCLRPSTASPSAAPSASPMPQAPRPSSSAKERLLTFTLTHLPTCPEL